jgi:uncharacterized protein
MLIVISPAKSLDFETPSIVEQKSSVQFKNEVQELIAQLKELGHQDIANLMGVSDALAKLNYERFQKFAKTYSDKNSKTALLAFQGDVYQGMEASQFSEAEFNYAQEHLRILSGLYGILRPLDRMQAYRLEMGTKFQNTGGKNLYEFWGDKITVNINKELKKTNSEYLVNLASNEYFKSIKKKDIKLPIITPQFKDQKNGEYKMISFFAKKARGAMTAYLIKNEVKSIDDLMKFEWDGYSFNQELSTELEPVFTR